MRWRTLAQVLLAGSVLADQQPFEAVGEDTSVGDFTFRKTIIDVLSADEDYTLLLKALQRARLVPTLNRINGSTLFAPTNAAIERYVKSHPDSLWASLVSDSPPTNPHNELRQHVFYHILNYTATPTTSNDLPAAPATFTHRTLHFPQAPNNGSGPPSREPPDLPPWMPVPGGLLAGEPQRVRITWRDDAAWVSVSEQGERGVKVVKADVEAANGRVVGIDSVLSLPKNLCE
jgi:solute carrier family 25 carnitine/acylcarnitine transporter 20/29